MFGVLAQLGDQRGRVDRPLWRATGQRLGRAPGPAGLGGRDPVVYGLMRRRQVFAVTGDLCRRRREVFEVDPQCHGHFLPSSPVAVTSV